MLVSIMPQLSAMLRVWSPNVGYICLYCRLGFEFNIPKLISDIEAESVRTTKKLSRNEMPPCFTNRIKKHNGNRVSASVNQYI